MRGRIFDDRVTAGRELAKAVATLELSRPLVVLGLPRGGVPVAYEVAHALRAPLDVLVVRKVGMPGQPELAIGAIAPGNVTVREGAGLPRMTDLDMRFEQVAKRERIELERRERAYRAGLPTLDLRGQTAILVDDGLATGATMIAAVRAARQAGAAFVVVAAPVASAEAAARLRGEADELAILEIPAFLFSIGEWYVNFEQIEDAEVNGLLERARREALDYQPPPKDATLRRRSGQRQ